ncbi:hypothetical protein GUJ93_ZPchr0006g41244 [Zizania palustris]|uniref:Uncharacterized protein n=1 Tax=Zizania palustris TaxID=103762 RepID=A0A8J5T692_ZIZPA|nr:hypothetical protein GUJ93_ZPchr0006g41244 [Zizania palustris]
MITRCISSFAWHGTHVGSDGSSCLALGYTATATGDTIFWRVKTKRGLYSEMRCFGKWSTMLGIITSLLLQSLQIHSNSEAPRTNALFSLCGLMAHACMAW